MADKLSEAEIAASLGRLEGWEHDGERGALVREFRFGDFGEAFGFMARVALLAEKAGHHPDWSNSYDRVSIALSTHSAGGITGKDVELAEAIGKLGG